LISDNELVAVGIIGRAVGLQGICAVTPLGQTLSRLELPGTVSIALEHSHQYSQLTLVECKKNGPGLRCRFEGCATREQAEALSRNILYIEQHRLPALRSNQYYRFELIGMRVVAESGGEPRGTVIAVHQYPTVHALEIKKENGAAVLVPLTGDYVKTIDMAQRTIALIDRTLDEIL